MKLFRAALLSLILLQFPPVAFAQQPAGSEQTSARLAGEVLVNGRAMEYARNLSDKFGVVTAHALAERPGRIAPQLKHDAVGELLRKANPEEFLKTVGVWK